MCQDTDDVGHVLEETRVPGCTQKLPHPNECQQMRVGSRVDIKKRTLVETGVDYVLRDERSFTTFKTCNKLLELLKSKCKKWEKRVSFIFVFKTMEEQTTDGYVEIPLSGSIVQQSQEQPADYPVYHDQHVTFAPPPPQHIAVNEYEQQRFMQFNTQAPGIPPPTPIFHCGDSERFVAYNTGFNAGYVRGYYVAVDNLNNREGQRLHQRYVSRGGGAFGSRGGGQHHSNDERLFVPRGRGRGSRGGRGSGGRGGGGAPNNSFVSPSGQHVEILRNIHFPPLQSIKPNTTPSPVVTGDENV